MFIGILAALLIIVVGIGLFRALHCLERGIMNSEDIAIWVVAGGLMILFIFFIATTC